MAQADCCAALRARVTIGVLQLLVAAAAASNPMAANHAKQRHKLSAQVGYALHEQPFLAAGQTVATANEHRRRQGWKLAALQCWATPSRACPCIIPTALVSSCDSASADVQIPACPAAAQQALVGDVRQVTLKRLTMLGRECSMPANGCHVLAGQHQVHMGPRHAQALSTRCSKVQQRSDGEQAHQGECLLSDTWQIAAQAGMQDSFASPCNGMRAADRC